MRFDRFFPILAFIFFGLPTFTFGQVMIKGSTKPAAKEISFFWMTDPLTEIPKHLKTVECDEKGKFVVQLDNPTHIRDLQIIVGDRSYPFYIQPNGTYEIQLHTNKQAITTIAEPPGDINQSLNTFSTEFLEWKKKTLDKIADQSLFNQKLKRYLNEKEKEIHLYVTPYVRQTIQYWINSRRFELNLGLYSLSKADELFKESLSGQEVSIYHLHFHKQIQLYLRAKLYKYGYRQEKPLYSLLFKTAEGIESKELAQLILLSSYRLALEVELLPKNDLIDMVKNLAGDLTVPAFCQWAEKLVQQHSSIQVGHPFVDFKLPDLDGNEFSLDDFKGQYVFLDYFGTWCSPCVKEMVLFPELVDEYKDRITFVSISFNDNPEKLKTFVEENQYNWTFLRAGFDPVVHTLFQAKRFPTYILLDPEGIILEYPAQRPSRKHFREYLDHLLTSTSTEH